jgi:protein-S-isoprenylcysteine O-methyltransferase Ste14
MTFPRPGLVMIGLWLGFALSWIVAAGWSKRTDKRIGMKREFGYRIVLLAGAAMLFIPAHGYVGPLRLWMVTRDIAWSCVGAIALGFAFSWWARIHLGALWSGWITKKSDHRVIDTGPYAIVRHPIYTGILLAVYATTLAKGTILGLIGAASVTAGLWMKARLEEEFLHQEIEGYDRYRKRVPMLIPFGPRST